MFCNELVGVVEARQALAYTRLEALKNFPRAHIEGGIFIRALTLWL